MFGRYDSNYLMAAERGARPRLWHIRARRVVLATGAIERPLVFPGNDRPGVMLASAVESYVESLRRRAGASCGSLHQQR